MPFHHQEIIYQRNIEHFFSGRFLGNHQRGFVCRTRKKASYGKLGHSGGEHLGSVVQFHAALLGVEGIVGEGGRIHDFIVPPQLGIDVINGKIKLLRSKVDVTVDGLQQNTDIIGVLYQWNNHRIHASCRQVFQIRLLYITVEEVSQHAVRVRFVGFGAHRRVDAANQVRLGGGVVYDEGIAVLKAAPGYQVVHARLQAGNGKGITFLTQGDAGFGCLGHELPALVEGINGHGGNLVAEGIGILEVEVELEAYGHLAVSSSVVYGFVTGRGQQSQQERRQQ